jgi:UDP-glucose 4-epimerase
MAKVVVTGGAGFIGSHIVDKLVARKHEVHIIDDLSSGSRNNIAHQSQVKLHVLDIRSNEARECVERLAPDFVVHAAAQVSVRISMDQPALDTDLNVTGLVNILSALTSHKGAHVVFLSSGGAIYGEQVAFPAKEDHPIKPESVYGLSKRVGEEYLEFWSRTWGVTSTSLRLSNVYGPRQNPHGEAGVVAIFCERLLAGKSIAINGSGKQTRDFVYVEDVAEAVGRAVDTRASGEFNIGTAKETSVTALAEQLRALTAPGAEIVYAEAKPGEQMRSCIDNSAAKAKLAWSPKVDFEQGLKHTVSWYRTKEA